MNTYIVKMEHPDGPKWNEFVFEHVVYLKGLISQNKLLASGPLKGTPLRAGFLIFQAENIEEVRAMVDADPFAREKLIVTLDIQQWDPLFGMLSEMSSKNVPAEVQTLFE